MSTTTQVWFATNRSEPRSGRKTYGDRFNSDGPHFYEVGGAEVTWNSPGASLADRDWDDATVSVSKARQIRPDRLDAETIPEITRKRETGAKLGSNELFADLRRRVREAQGDILLYIHGFANGFEDSLMRAAQLSEVYAFDCPAGRTRPAGHVQPLTVVFAWPSDGMVQPPWKYASDRDDAAMSGVAMARALRRFIDFLDANEGDRCPYRIHLVAHSMGNWALRHAVQGLRALNDGARLPRLIDSAFLMAADEDDDCFEHDAKLRPLSELARRIHVYHSADDIALHVSDKTKGNRDRLGTAGPRSFSGLDTRIKAIDCSVVDGTEMFHGSHQYYRLRPEVIADVRAVLAGSGSPGLIPGREVIEPGRRYRLHAASITG